MTRSRFLLPVLLTVGSAVTGLAQPNRPPTRPPARPPSAPPIAPSDIEMVEKILSIRKDYQTTLEKLRAHYLTVGDQERAKWAEEELISYHRMLKPAYRLELDVPPPTLTASYNVPEANELYRRAMQYKDRGYGTDYIDNQRRAELLLQQLLTQYPTSDKIDRAAYQLGEIYESRAYKQPKRSAVYFERAFQWNPNTHSDARLRAARVYDRQVNDKQKAVELYKEVVRHETDAARIDEAKKRIDVLTGK